MYFAFCFMRKNFGYQLFSNFKSKFSQNSNQNSNHFFSQTLSKFKSLFSQTSNQNPQTFLKLPSLKTPQISNPLVQNHQAEKISTPLKFFTQHLFPDSVQTHLTPWPRYPTSTTPYCDPTVILLCPFHCIPSL